MNYSYSYADYVHLSQEDLRSYKASLNTQPLEQWLTNWWAGVEKLSDPNVMYAERAAFGKITFYIWWLMQNISLAYGPDNGYRKFLIKLKTKQEYPNIISFNYDTLLDKALTDVFGVILQGSLEKYAEARYIKPHGSINWFLSKRAGELNMGAEHQRRMLWNY